jgi:chemosensory pili system protein ChpA (sensor histidine kinase/response regulator)
MEETGTVLIADDERDVRECMKLRLEREGFRVIAVSSGKEAIEEITEHLPDLAIIDVTMPGLNGFKVKELLNQNFPKLPVVLMSGSIEGDEERRSKIDLGKPYTKEELRDVINKFLKT